MLVPLADNGGPTQTHALLWGSPAIDAGDDASCPATDQRGAARPGGAHCDIGAFEYVVYTLAYTAGANGTISGTSAQTVEHGADGTAVEAVPNTGYHFVQWSDDSTVNPRTDANVTANVSVTATFAINTYTLTYIAGEHGTISGTTPQTVEHGSNGTTVEAVPNANYHFTQWSDGVMTASRTDTNVMANVSVTAEFAIDTYTLTYTAGVNGTISGTTPQTVNHGASGTAVTAVPDTDYHFVQWSDGNTTNPRTDTNVMANVNVTASFAINTYTLTYTAGANGTISGTTPQTINHGASGTAVTAVPNQGYHFVQWSDGVLTASRTDTNVTANINVTATFRHQHGPVISGPSLLSVMSEDGSPIVWSAPELSATDADGDTLTWSVSSGPAHGAATVSGTEASPTTFTYAPNANWNGADSFVVQVSDSSGGTDTITVNVTIEAVNDAPSFTAGADQRAPKTPGRKP